MIHFRRRLILSHNIFSRSFSTAPYNAEIDYYHTLGLTSKCTQDQIKKKFYELAKKYHPDAHVEDEKYTEKQEQHFKKVTEAYNILSDENIRKQYDSARNPHLDDSLHGHQGSGQSSSRQQNNERTYSFNRKTGNFTYNSGESSNPFHNPHRQQSREEWQKTQKENQEYNYFYEDIRRQQQQQQRDFERRYGAKDRYEPFQHGKSSQQVRMEKGGMTLPLAYFFFGLFAINCITGIIFNRQPAKGGQLGEKGGGYTGGNDTFHMNQRYQGAHVSQDPGASSSLSQGKAAIFKDEGSTFKPQRGGTRSYKPEDKSDSNKKGGRVLNTQGKTDEAFIPNEGEKLLSLSDQVNQQDAWRNFIPEEEVEDNKISKQQAQLLMNLDEINSISAKKGLPIIRAEVKMQASAGPAEPLLVPKHLRKNAQNRNRAKENAGKKKIEKEGNGRTKTMAESNCSDCTVIQI